MLIASYTQMESPLLIFQPPPGWTLSSHMFCSFTQAVVREVPQSCFFRLLLYPAAPHNNIISQGYHRSEQTPCLFTCCWCSPISCCIRSASRRAVGALPNRCPSHCTYILQLHAMRAASVLRPRLRPQQQALSIPILYLPIPYFADPHNMQ